MASLDHQVYMSVNSGATCGIFSGLAVAVTLSLCVSASLN